MSTNQDSNDLWEECPRGEFARMVSRLNRSSRRDQVRQFSTTVAVSAVITGAAVLYWGVFIQDGHPQFGGITCAECKDNMADYRDFLVDQVPLKDPALASSMEGHLTECPLCRPYFESLYPGVLTAWHDLNRPLQNRLIPLLATTRQPSY